MNYWPWTNTPPQYETTYPNAQPQYISWKWWYNCPHCGAVIEVGWKYCPHCGKNLSIAEDNPTLESITKKLDELLEVLQSCKEKTSNEEG